MAYMAPFDVGPLSYEKAVVLAHDTGFIAGSGDALLEPVVALLDELGRPDKSFDIIQVAGTNGKTSTARYTAAALAAEGLACALYTSPELVAVTATRGKACASSSAMPSTSLSASTAHRSCGREATSGSISASESRNARTDCGLCAASMRCMGEPVSTLKRPGVGHSPRVSERWYWSSGRAR